MGSEKLQDKDSEEETMTGEENDEDKLSIKIVRERCQDPDWTSDLDNPSTVEMSVNDVLRFAALQEKEPLSDGKKIQETHPRITRGEALPTPENPPSYHPGAYSVAFVPDGTRTVRVVQRRNEGAADEIELLEEGEIDSHDTGPSNNNEEEPPLPPTVEDAVLVEDRTEIPPNEVFEGEVSTKKSVVNSRRGWLFLLGLFIMGVTVLVLSLYFTHDSASKPASGGDSAGIGDYETFTVPYTKDLPMEILKGIEQVGSSNYRANAWMLQDPYLHTYTQERQKQRFQLAYFFFQSNGHNWTRNTHWLSYDVSECEWFMHNSSLDSSGWHKGMEPEPICDQDSNLRVVNLTSNNLNGRSPVQSGGMSRHLLIFDISENEIKGPLPPVAGFAPDIEVFIASNNQLEGQIIGSGLQAFKYRVVKLDGNQLLGHIPLICMIVPQLEVLDVSGNLFDQDLYHLHLCRNMTHLILRDNFFTGTIPTELALLSSLKELDLSGNALISGTIPTELGQVTTLQYLDLLRTHVVGPIPKRLCDRRKEGNFDIAVNCSSIRCCD